ncbi:tetratricopeptide repeat protein [Colidextribacter sp. OB.20]|uniref:tetratricopeptide repeat protein n=1 Tax=Colidextribacter sp. OB.20 TaxID=2304568 RepID=UPI0013721C46|nr:tetratricopeptide repeat protein [Colidextribacter sp. OB.20]NBI10719.1 tetratricopeptide repeat protein [Colidextribacter sp. OB.20]
MNDFLNQLEQWNEEDKYQEIIDAVEALPREKWDFTLTSALARAYNNLAMDLMPPEDRPLYQRALELLLPLEDQLEEAAKQDPDVAHTWNFRVAYAHFYLGQESQALPYFEKALEARPGDEDTLEMIDRCNRNLALPLNMKPFRGRAEEGWSAFLEGEKELRALMDQEDREAVGEKLVARCTELLSPAFADVAFELGHNGEKYELILVPEGDRTRLFQLAYFQKRVPKELLDKWNILVGRTRSSGFGLRMNGQDITPEDVQVWAEKTPDNGLGLRLYCEKLAPLWREDQNQVYNIIYILLDQALGELAAMRYVDYLDILDAPVEGEGITLDRLADFVATEVDPEGWPRANDPELAGERYTAYEGKPSEKEDWPLRADVYVGVTCCVPLLKGYLQGDDYYIDRLHRDGVVPGFFYYPLDGIDKKDILDLRDQLEQAITARCGEGIVTFIGGATGTELGYLDFIAWDLRVLLDAAVEVFAGAPVQWAAFHTFRFNVSGIGLKQDKEE